MLGAVIGVVALPMLTVAGLVAFGALIGAGGLLVGPGLLLAIGIGLMSKPPTRPWGVGLMIGGFGMLIVLGGACVAILTGLEASGG